MAIVVQPADLDLDRGLLIGLLSRFLTPLSDGCRYDWLYRQGPFGPARAWIATDTVSGQAIGVAAAFPRRLLSEGEEIAGCVLGDFCVHPRYRSLGPALQLQRACMQGVGIEAFALGYDFPSANMLAVYTRLGVEPCDEMVRLAKPLRADRKIAESVKVKWVSRGLSSVANQALRWRDAGLGTRKGWTLSLHEAPFDEEFSALARQLRPRSGACVERSAEYLNWRYRAHPSQRYEVVTARQSGRLAGYVVFTQAGQDARIVDLFGPEEKSLLRELVARVVEFLRERSVITLSVPILLSHPRVRWFEEWGFRQRESAPVVFFVPGTLGSIQEPRPRAGWLLMEGDRDS